MTEQEENMNLSAQINQTRNRMIKIGQAKGLSNQWTVAVSQELDKLMNEEQKKGMAI